MIPMGALGAVDDVSHVYLSYERNEMNRRMGIQQGNPSNNPSDLGVVGTLMIGGAAGLGVSAAVLGPKAALGGIGLAGKGMWNATKGWATTGPGIVVKGGKLLGSSVAGYAKAWGYATAGSRGFAKGLAHNALSGAKFGAMFTPGLGFAANFIQGGGKGMMALGVLGSAVSFGMDSYRWYDDVFNQKTGPAMASASLTKTWGAMSVGGLIGGIVGQVAIPIPMVGSMVGAMVGSMGLDYLANNPTVIELANRTLGTNIMNTEMGKQAAITGGQGFYYRNPFSPNSYGMVGGNNQYIATMRQASLQAIQSSPLADRGRLLGNEARRLAGL